MAELAISTLRDEAAAALTMDPYRAMNALWLVLVKTANRFPRVAQEHEQIASLLRRFSRAEASRVASTKGVDELLALDPPLETILSDSGERLGTEKTRKELARISELRTLDPKAALMATFEILQRIRDKREHGFKSPNGRRDTEILTAGVSILWPMVETCLQKVEVKDLSASEPGTRKGS